MPTSLNEKTITNLCFYCSKEATHYCRACYCFCCDNEECKTLKHDCNSGGGTNQIKERQKIYDEGIQTNVRDYLRDAKNTVKIKISK